jgi:hypothetical protein
MAQQINLFSPLFLKKRKHFSAATMLQALAVILVGIVGFYGYAVYQVRGLQRTAADTAATLRIQSEQVASISKEFSPQGRSRLLEEEAARLNARLKQREDLLVLVRTGGLGNTTGFSRYLFALARQGTPGVWLTGVTVAGDEASLLLNGRALHADLVPTYIRALNKEEVMRGRRVSELRMTAREQQATATAAPGGATGSAPAAGGAAATPQGAPAPMRYVEFNIIATREAGK